MKDDLNKIFKDLENKFDIEIPEIGHFERFEAKLNQKQKRTSTNKPFKLLSLIAIAASIVLIVGIWIGSSFSNKGMELASISTKMEETQSYFVSTIEKELEKIELERSSDSEQLITDALSQINKLETQYKLLTFELKESTEDERIIYAMILNFQQRIELLQELLIQIEGIKQLKTQNNEKYI